MEKVADLQQQTKRLMILRVLKSRLVQPGKHQRVMLDGAHNMFYGTCDEFIPPEGFVTDDGAPAFDDDSKVVMTIYAELMKRDTAGGSRISGDS